MPGKGSRWLLAAGDLLAFLLFAALGRHSHEEAGNLAQLVGTAAPFAISWFAVAPWLGAFPKAPRFQPRNLLSRTALAWLCAWPIGLLLRAVLLRRGVPLSFALVVLAANAVFLLGWRGLYAVARMRRV
jgi:Protein of unknown function (DUF3054)